MATDCSEATAAHAARLSATPVAGLSGIDGIFFAEAQAEPVGADPADRIAALIYTSGTTGEPKAVMLTHANLLFGAKSSGRRREVSQADRVYGVLPFSHVQGLASVFVASLYCGAELHLVPRFEPEAVAHAFAEVGISVFQGAPTMYARLIELAERCGRDLSAPCLRYISAGGAPLDLGLKGRVERMWRLPLHNGYGITETSAAVAVTRTESPASDDSVGPALLGIKFRIVDPETLVDTPTGEVGEVWISGGGVMKGYYKAPEATAHALTADGWFRSGDLGRLDAYGNLYISSRLKELIIRSGFNVYPPEVEAALLLHPAVALAAVVGRRVVDRNGVNEEVVAFIEPKAGQTLDEATLKTFVAERLAPYKRPMHYFFRSHLPTTATGKLRKAELVAEAQVRISGLSQSQGCLPFGP
jgi:long-chain acyl-CoA synthetase